MGKGRDIEIIVRGLLSNRAGQVLLCRNLKRGYRYLPGGHVEFGERATVALVREYEEETGLGIQCGDLLATSENVFDDRGRTRHEVNLLFRVEHVRLGVPSEPPREVTSIEPKISFEWASPTALGEDVRPAGLISLVAHGSIVKSVWLSEGQPG